MRKRIASVLFILAALPAFIGCVKKEGDSSSADAPKAPPVSLLSPGSTTEAPKPDTTSNSFPSTTTNQPSTGSSSSSMSAGILGGSSSNLAVTTDTKKRHGKKGRHSRRRHGRHRHGRRHSSRRKHHKSTTA